MLLVNETGVPVTYSISTAGMADCGTIDVGGLASLPAYDNQTNVTVSFLPAPGNYFTATIAKTETGNMVEMALLEG